MAYKRNPQLITSYDIITPSQVVLGHTSVERVVSAQPAGYEALLNADGTSWEVRDMSKQQRIDNAESLKKVKQVIADNHNTEEQQVFRQYAVAWVDYYQAHPIDKRGVNPQVIESIYRCAARARLHPNDQPITTATAVQ